MSAGKNVSVKELFGAAREQQFGRALRVMGATCPPDKVRDWSLERRGKRASRDSDALSGKS